MPNKPTTLREEFNEKLNKMFADMLRSKDRSDMNSVVQDQLPEVLKSYLTSHNTELVSKIEGMRKELWLDYHNAQKWSEQKAVAEALDQVISLINQEK